MLQEEFGQVKYKNGHRSPTRAGPFELEYKVLALKVEGFSGLLFVWDFGGLRGVLRLRDCLSLSAPAPPPYS